MTVRETVSRQRERVEVRKRTAAMAGTATTATRQRRTVGTPVQARSDDSQPLFIPKSFGCSLQRRKDFAIGWSVWFVSVVINV
ncbi:hypothetical protein Hanom_Chr16g01438341 [Helianthus anomalus]